MPVCLAAFLLSSVDSIISFKGGLGFCCGYAVTKNNVVIADSIR